MVKIRELLCATDIDAPADSALRYSFFITERFGCALHLLHATEQGGLAASTSGAARMELRLKARRLRERADEVARSGCDPRAESATSHVAGGTWSNALLGLSERQRTDVIVLGSVARGEGSRASVLNVSSFAQRTPCPVLTVPAAEVASRPCIDRILLALDPEATTGELIQWAALWARTFGAAVRLLYCEPTRPDAGATLARWQREAQAQLRIAGVQTLDECVVGTRPRLAEGILARASHDASDLIVMNASPYGDVEGCVVAAVRRDSKALVMSLRHNPPAPLFIDSGRLRERASWPRAGAELGLTG